MKYDEFAFFNQQLGTMLRDGIPLEGALRQLCASMQRGEMREQMEQLEAALKAGTPLDAALAPRQLPDFYKQMLRIGAQGNDLPGMLLMLADYYQRVDSVWARLKGLMVYPLLVLTAAFALSCFLTYGFTHLIAMNFAELMGVAVPKTLLMTLWAPPILLGAVLVLFLAVLLVPSFGRSLRWRLPAFREAKLSQVASAMWLMLKGGGNLDDALNMVQQLERGTPASAELAQWKTRLAGGRGKFDEMAIAGKAFPPMFLWLVGNAGEDLAGGFQRAADIYGARAAYRTDMILLSILPLSIMILGTMIICQVVPFVRTFVTWMNTLN